MAIGVLWRVVSHAHLREYVVRLPGMVVAIGRIAADSSMPTTTRILASDFLFELCGEALDGDAAPHTSQAELEEAARWKKQFAEVVVGQFQGFSGPFPKLALVTRFLDSDDADAQAYGADMIARGAKTQRQKAALAKLNGPRKLARLLRRAAEERVVSCLCCTPRSHHSEYSQPHALQVASSLHALLNLTTQEDCQQQTGRWGIQSLMAFARNVTYPQLQVLATKIMQNVQKHASNRTRLYNEELRLRLQDCRNDPSVRGMLCSVERPLCSR